MTPPVDIALKNRMLLRHLFIHIVPFITVYVNKKENFKLVEFDQFKKRGANALRLLNVIDCFHFFRIKFEQLN